MLARDIAAERRALPLIISSSRLDAKKNITGLVRAYAENPRLQALANLAIVVRGAPDPLRDQGHFTGAEQAILAEIVAMMDAHGLWGKITGFPLNSQTALAAAYRYLAERRSVFALTSLHEPFGLAPLEAMAAGLPVVVTKNGGPTESLLDADTGESYGVLVDPEDEEDIVRGLLGLLGNPGRWQRYQVAGFHRVIDRYTWEKTAEGYLDVLEKV
jgi:sucrose-phosphate synthase